MSFFLKNAPKHRVIKKICFFTQLLGHIYRTIIFDINLHGKIPVLRKKGAKMSIFSDNAQNQRFLKKTFGFTHWYQVVHKNTPHLT